MKRKIITIIILIAMIISISGSLFLYSKPAKAFPVVDLISAIFEPLKWGVSVTTRMTDFIDKNLSKAGAIAFKNGLSYFLSKIAQDTATWIASGDKGAKPLFITKGWGSYLEEVGDEALGMFVYDLFNSNHVGYCSMDKTVKCKNDSDCTSAATRDFGDFDFSDEDIMDMDSADRDWFSDSVDTAKNYCVITGTTGTNVCSPKNLYTRLTIQYSILTAKTAPLRKPVCSWQDMKANWKKEINDPNFLKNFSVNWEPTQTDVGVWLTLRTNLDNVVNNAAEVAVQERQEGKGFKPVTNLIGKTIKTPAVVIGEITKKPIVDSTNKETAYTGQIWADALGVFTNTLASRLMDKWIKKGMWTLQDLTKKSSSFGGLQFSDSDYSLTPQQAARDFYNDLGKPDYSSGSSVGITNMLSRDCNTDPETGSEQFCGVIDNNFATAIDQKLILKDAITQGLIKGDRPFGFLLNGGEPSYRDGIPYRSIVILRKYRVVPVGWELAAQYIEAKFGLDEAEEVYPADVKSISLNYLLNSYNNPTSPFYKLIDPNWQLKAPETICQRQGAGPDIINEQVRCANEASIDECASEDRIVYLTRRTYCADERSCIVENNSGTGCDFYGYCTKEKPIWRLQGDMCPAYFNTCQTFSMIGSTESYLENTLDDCNTPDCWAYCEAFDPEQEEWKCNIQEHPVVHYSSSQFCSEDEQGCTFFKRVLNWDQTTPLTNQQIQDVDKSDTGFYEKDIGLKIAPEYSENKFSCDGYNMLKDEYSGYQACADDGFYWRDDFNICVESGNQFCENFAFECSHDDMNCKLYTPISITAPAVPAVIVPRESDIVWNDECPEVCVGYRNYTQKANQFEDITPESFIESTAQKCSQSDCDEYTNLDKVSMGGEGIEYYSYLRLCVKPDDPNVKTFYTWEGSDTQGYQLKKWLLEATNNQPSGDSCDIDNPDIDCREFYNPETNTYYPIDFSTVVFVSDDCHPFRRTMDGDTYYGIASYSTLCSANNAGCRTYRDNSSYNYEIVLSDDFEDGDTNGWRYVTSQDNPEISRESVKRGGYSMKMTEQTEYPLSEGDLLANGSYTITFIAKGSGGVTMILDGNDGAFQTSQELSVTNSWNLYTVIFEDPLPEQEYTYPKLIILPSDTYIDLITIKRINNILVIKDSWQNEEICDTLSDAGMLWCEAFKDNNEDVWNLQNFSNLCMEDVVGCEAMIGFDDNNEREWRYYVYDKNKECPIDSVGCKKLGKVKSDKFQPEEISKYTFEEKFMIINKGLDECGVEDNRCMMFSYKDSQAYNYYKDPQNRICEFRNGDWWVVGEDNLKCPGTEGYCSNDYNINCNQGNFDINCVDGEGVIHFCISESQEIIGINREKHCLGGKSELKDNTCNSDDDCLSYYTFNGEQPGICTSWTGVCSADESGCQEYQDPFAPNPCDNDLLPYQFSSAYPVYEPNRTPACDFYWYRNVNECSEGANPDGTCVRFVDTSKEVPIQYNIIRKKKYE